MSQYKGELISAKEGDQREKEYSLERGGFLYFFQWKGATFCWAKFSRKCGNSIQTNKNNHFQIHCRSLMIQYFAVLERDKIVSFFICLEFNLRLMHAYLQLILVVISSLAKNLGNFNFKQEKYPQKCLHNAITWSTINYC